MLEYRGRRDNTAEQGCVIVSWPATLNTLLWNKWVGLFTTCCPANSELGSWVSVGDIGKYSHSHLVLGGVSVLNMLRPGRGPGCKCVNWTVGRVSRFYPVTNLYLILNMDPEYGINLYCQPFRHLINENKWARARRSDPDLTRDCATPPLSPSLLSPSHSLTLSIHTN